MMKSISLGTRASDLALAQANIVKKLLEKKLNLKVQILTIKTSGDKISQKINFAQKSNTNIKSEHFDKGTFIKELEIALLNNKIDIAVHSLKDVPSDLDKNFTLPVIFKKKSPLDILILNNDQNYKSIKNLPNSFTIGTNSLRRKFAILSINKNLQVIPIRGNVPTRLDKLVQNKNLNGIILAKAGLERLDYTIKKKLLTL